MNKKITIIFAFAIHLCGCKISQPAAIRENITTKIEEIFHDSTAIIPGDTVILAQSLKVFSDLKKTHRKKTVLKKGRAGVRYKITKDSLHLVCICDSVSIYLSWKDKYKTVTDTIKISNPLTFWQNFQIYVGRFAILLIGAELVYFAVKLRR